MIDPSEPRDPLLMQLAELCDHARRLGCDEADLRAVDREMHWLTVRGEQLDVQEQNHDSGVGVRVRIGAATGYAATEDRGPGAMRLAVERATAMARAAAAHQPAAEPLAPAPASVGTYLTPMPGGDPFRRPFGERLARLRALSAGIGSDSRIAIARATEVLLRRRTRLATLAGTRIDQTVTIAGGCIQAIAEEAGQLQQRSWPKDFDGNVLQGGLEVFDRLRLEDHVDRVREEALALCHAPPCPEMRSDLILGGSQLSLQIHESCGHPTEADRALREELSLAGSSFLTPERLREGFRYGSPIVNLVADATTPLGPGTFGWDDEGVPANRSPLVEEGVFRGYLTSRATSERVGCAPVSACRAESWSAEPIVRMVNINLLPGDAGTLDDLIAATDRGLLIDTNRSWSIDDHRLNFQFGCEAAWEIRGGRRGRLYRNPVYTGITPEFWRSCDAICGPEAWQMWGWFFCGKGDPVQLMHVGHGTAPARFRGVRVGAS